MGWVKPVLVIVVECSLQIAPIATWYSGGLEQAREAGFLIYYIQLKIQIFSLVSITIKDGLWLNDDNL